MHYIQKRNHKCFKLESDKGRQSWKPKVGRWGAHANNVNYLKNNLLNYILVIEKEIFISPKFGYI